MGIKRRSVTIGMAALLLPGAILARPRGGVADDATGRLHDFLSTTVGRSGAEREATARRMLATLTPLALPTLLVEIAAIGTLVRGASTGDSLREGYPRRSRAALDFAQRKIGDAGWTKALDGAWHYEVLRRSRIGAMLYGASRQKGETLFAEAVALDPADGGIRLAHVVALLGGEAADAAKRAPALLRDLPDADPSPYGRLVETQARILAKLLQDGRSMDAAQHALKLF